MPLQTGDIILSVNRQSIAHPRNWAEIRHRIAPRDMVNVSVRRTGKTYQVQAALGERDRGGPRLRPRQPGAAGAEQPRSSHRSSPETASSTSTGRIVQSGRTEEIREEQLACRDGPSTLLVLAGGPAAKPSPLSPAEMGRLRTSLVEKYSGVFVSASIPRLPTV